ncbi:hypothetical protein HNP38_000689 [Chryseobacterium defluvii]|uniref:Uncharacterized protein n=1 Tax=Chryseobacterium defluvii TaxID=160396 RepID=A0A840KBN6_9FLAO|nr:hypothetical protein [Chryseobacterium defluvii]MBB4805417.1 hypothetical protein [Chryseobacterium defluvii]
MKTILIPFILVSVLVSAQKKEKVLPSPKTGPIKIYEYNDLMKLQNKSSLERQQKKEYEMPVAKPKNDFVYSGLNEPQKDHSEYKILNSTPPEKPENEPKK